MAPPENNFHKNVQQKSIFIPFASYRRKENYHIYLKGISAFLSDSEECKIQRILELLPHQTSQDYILQISEDSLETSPSVKHLIKFVETNLSNNDLYKPHYNQLLQDLRRTRHNPNFQNSYSKLIEECLDKAKVLDEQYYEQLAIDQIIMSIPIELQIKICVNPTRPSLEDVKTVLTKEDRKRRILNYKSNTEVPKPSSNPTATNKNKDTSSQSTPIRFVPSDTIESMEDGLSSCFGEITFNDLKITTSTSLDSGAGNNYVGQVFFDSLPLSVQRQLDPNVKILVTNAHGGKSLTKEAIDLTTSLTGCKKLQHQKLRFLLDPLSEVITIGMKTLKEFSVNIFECEKIQQAPKENVSLNTLDFDEQIDMYARIRLSKDYRPKRFPILAIKSHLIDKVEEKVEEEVRRGIIRKVSDKFGGERSFAVIVDNGPNKDPRICLALLNINKYTELKPYVLPKIRDLTMFNKKNFNVVSVLDISGAFNTIGLEDDSIPLTRFGLPFGIYEYVRLPFGWKKPPEIWIEVITKLLQPIESENCSLTIYMDDLLLRLHVSDHGKLLRQIIIILMNHNIQISLHKCKFFADSVPYLGFNYSISQGLSIPINTVSGIVNLKVPSNRDELKRTLASLNYFSSNVVEFSMMAAEFYSMLSNKESSRSTLLWDQVTTNKFKNLLTSFAKAIALQDVPSDITNTLFYPVANLNAISVITAVKNSTNDISLLEFTTEF